MRRLAEYSSIFRIGPPGWSKFAWLTWQVLRMVCGKRVGFRVCGIHGAILGGSESTLPVMVWLTAWMSMKQLFRFVWHMTRRNKGYFRICTMGYTTVPHKLQSSPTESMDFETTCADYAHERSKCWATGFVDMSVISGCEPISDLKVK